MRHWIKQAQEMLASDGAFVLATIVGTKGSVPRGVGTKMLVSAKQFMGTIGGGNLEYQVTEQARKLLVSEPSGYKVQQYALGPVLEQCCGGSVEIMLECLDAESAAFLNEPRLPFLKTTYSKGAFVKAWAETDTLSRNSSDTEVLADAEAMADTKLLGPLFLYSATGEAVETAKKAATLVEDVRRPKHPVYIFGAGHVGRAVVRALAPLPFDVTWVDSRMAEFPSTVPENTSIQVTDAYLPCVDKAPIGTAYLVFTHSHQLDYDVTAKILGRRDAAYCGLIGSATKRARFENRMLRDHHITEADLPKLTCPIGLGSIEGHEPAVIAASVVAQLLASLC